MSTDARAWLEFAHTLADRADRRTLADFRDAMDVRRKDDGSFVTDADQGVEVDLRAAIADRFPDHVVLGEEYGGQVDAARPSWIIDPIDGTNNFVTGNPVYATLIAVEHGDTRVAVVSAPALHARWDGLVTADVRRATQDGREVQVSDRTLAAGQVSFGGLNYFLDAGRRGLVEGLTGATRRQRGFGDFWQHCLVASGVLEVAVEAEVSPWDLAAVRCVVQAAGGRFSDLDGVDTIHGGNALSTNGLVHDEVLAMAHRDGAVDA